MSRVANRGSSRSAGLVHRAEERVREGIGERADRHVAVGGTVDAERRQPGHRRTGASGHAERAQRVEGLVGDERGQRAQHRHVHVLADAGGARLMQRGQHADDAEERRRQVGDGEADAHRRVRRLSRGVHHAAQRLDDRVHGLAVVGAAGGSEAADRAVHQARVHLVDEVVADAQPVQDAAAEVLHQDVRALRQVAEHVPGGRDA